MSELDRKMAEVMGYIYYFNNMDTYDYWLEPQEPESKIVIECVNWTPSTNISQALFEVVEKMLKRGFVYNLENRTDGTHDCQFHHLESGRWFEMVNHENPATAICLAAEQAVGG